MHPKVKHPRFFIKEKQGLEKFNRELAVSLGNKLGSMGFFYVCVILDLAELPAVISSHSIIAWVTYIAQTVVQLIALPIISTQQNIQQEITNAKSEADHMALTHIANVVDDIKANVVK